MLRHLSKLNRPSRVLLSRVLLSCAAIALVAIGTARAQQSGRTPTTLTATPAPYRSLAPGVEVTIPADPQEEETFTQKDIVEILQSVPGLDWKPKLSPESRTLKQMATGTTFRREVWCLEFTFKPMRTIWVDVPQADGSTQRRLIWYLVYHVRNTGTNLQPTRQDDGSFLVKPVSREIRFFPQFVLESHEFQKAYLDRIIPAAIPLIQAREDAGRKLLNSVEIGSKAIPVSTDLIDKSVWGVATWETVDPRIDYFSVFIEGLTNAYRWTDPAAAQGGKGRILSQKNLMLNFWRPGDEYLNEKHVIRYGIPGKVDYSWVYR